MLHGCCTNRFLASLTDRRARQNASLAEERGLVLRQTQAIQETGPDQVLQRGPPNRRSAERSATLANGLSSRLRRIAESAVPKTLCALKWLKSSFPTSSE